MFINSIFAYEDIMIEDGYSYIYKESNNTNDLNSTQIYINYYDKNSDLNTKKSSYYGHIFTQGNIYYFSDAVFKKDDNKTTFSVKKGNFYIKADISDKNFDGFIRLDHKVYDINATLDKKYSLIMLSATANFEEISQRDFEFKKSFVYEDVDFKDQNSSMKRFKMANLLKNSYIDEINAWYNEFFSANNVNFDSPIFIRRTHDIENIYYTKGNLTVFSNDVYFYSGGAHDNTMKNYEVDLNDKKLELQDILKDPNDEKLISMIWDKVKVYAYIKQDDLEISSNFAISPYGITFAYNPYEIGPFSAGIIEAYFSFDEIRPFLKESFLEAL